MLKKPILITCQPDDSYYSWQNHLYIESCLSVGFEQEQIHILLYTPPYRQYNEGWDKLKLIYPNISIHKYTDSGKGCSRYFGIYVPILRPHILAQHFDKFRELKNEVIIYTDCDIIWTKKPDIEKLYNDDINYMSDAKSYMNNSYFESKYSHVLESKKEEVKNVDFLDTICKGVGISKEKVVENNDNIGGVQYILKNIDGDFWKKVETDCLNIRAYLMAMNKQFYKDENAGVQSWCSDLWSVIFNLWHFNREVKIVPELQFAWSSDRIERLSEVSILHNAGIVSELQGDIPVFYKGKYHTGKNPFNDPHLELVHNNEKSKSLCNWYYVDQLIKLKNKYSLNYLN